MSRESYNTFIGLEIHIHLKTTSKMFCSCQASYGDNPNTNVCPVCLGYPGTLPQANGKAIEMGYLIARTLNCHLGERMSFARKNYFYPDMPKNYQISQFEEPIGKNGWIEVNLGTEERRIRIHDVHLEEDAGKMIHQGDVTFLDFNRAGYPLMEIVTEPDLKSGEEAEFFLRHFQRLIRYLDVSDGNMDEGSMKCDANISVNLSEKKLGTKVEVKNMNSPRFIRLAMNYEAKRQVEVLESGGTLVQETRLWNENRDTTEIMRQKESSDDYRYFPEPDIPPFTPDKDFLSRIEAALVETPLALKKRLIETYSLSEEQAEFIHNEKATSLFFEETIHLGSLPRSAAAWLSSDVKKILNRTGMKISDSPLTANRLARLIGMIEEGLISGKIAKTVLDKIFECGEDPDVIVERDNLSQISDPVVLKNIIDSVMSKNSQVVQAVCEGDNRQRGWLLGQIMKESEGRAAPELAGKILDECLKNNGN